MGIFDRIGRMFGGRKKPTLKELPLDDLKREQFAIQNELRKLESDNEKNENDELQLKEEYKAAHLANRETSKRSVAQKLQNLKMRRKGVETRLAYTNKMFQVVTGMIIIKENMAFFEKIGVGSVISNMDLGELENYVAEATIEGTLQQEKLAAMLRGIDDGVLQLGSVSQDTSIGEFMAELDAELLETSPPKEQIPISTCDLDHVMKTIDVVAARGMDVAKKMQQESSAEQNTQHVQNDAELREKQQ